MKFAHLADCHVGAWREPLMRELSVQAFESTIDRCIKERVDFVIIAGDLFHTAIPSLDGVKSVFKKLYSLRQAGIPLYFICGSHDYSPTGKTMLDIIEEAGLGKNVFRGKIVDNKLRLSWTIDEKTGVKLTGILGRANQLDSEIYTTIDQQALETEPGTKIFLFHTSIEELKANGTVYDSSPLSLLPKGCMYYAGGHVHTRLNKIVEGRHIVYPGPLFPASFSELEELETGSFCIVQNNHVEHIKVEIKPVIAKTIDCTGKDPAAIQNMLLEGAQNVKDAIVLMRLTGIIAGRMHDIAWKHINEEYSRMGAYIVLRNTAALSNPELQRTMISVGSLDDIEEKVLQEHKVDIQLVKKLMNALSQEQGDGEKRGTYEDRILESARAITKEWNGNQG